MTALNANHCTVLQIVEVSTGKESWLSTYVRSKLLFYQVYNFPASLDPVYVSSTTKVFIVDDYTDVR
jgi:hypothetical protein